MRETAGANSRFSAPTPVSPQPAASPDSFARLVKREKSAPLCGLTRCPDKPERPKRSGFSACRTNPDQMKSYPDSRNNFALYLCAARLRKSPKRPRPVTGSSRRSVRHTAPAPRYLENRASRMSLLFSGAMAMCRCNRAPLKNSRQPVSTVRLQLDFARLVKSPLSLAAAYPVAHSWEPASRRQAPTAF